jgi:uncharacterized membrane protein
VTFTEIMEHVAQAFEWLGVLILAAGSLCAFLLAGLDWRRRVDAKQAYALTRQFLGGTLLLGLEVLVAADLVRTIAIAPTLENALTLGLIVLIRTFLSFSLEIEITGKLPWRRPGQGELPGQAATASLSQNPVSPMGIRLRSGHV